MNRLCLWPPHLQFIISSIKILFHDPLEQLAGASQHLFNAGCPLQLPNSQMPLLLLNYQLAQENQPSYLTQIDLMMENFQAHLIAKGTSITWLASSAGVFQRSITPIIRACCPCLEADCILQPWPNAPHAQRSNGTSASDFADNLHLMQALKGQLLSGLTRAQPQPPNMPLEA